MLLRYLQDKRLIAGIMTLVLFVFVIYASIPFISAFFGAAILAFIFRPLDKKLRKQGISPSLSSAIILIIALILIIIPIIFIINGLINQVSLLPNQIQKLKIVKENLQEILPFNIDFNSKEIANQLTPIISSLIQPIFTNTLDFFIIMFLLFFLFYYFILLYETFKSIIIKILPFNEKNNKEIIEKFKQITYSTVIGTFLIAIIQGSLIALNFYFLGIPNALFWGFVAAVLSFLPVIGPPVIWVPASILLILSGNPIKGIALIIIGFLISLIDNIIRPIVNQKYGSVHPLISIIGIYIGVSQFGIIGLFIGPLIVAYLFLFWRLYKEEYLR